MLLKRRTITPTAAQRPTRVLTVRATAKPLKLLAKTAAPVSAYEIPNEPTEPVDDLGAYSWLIYGDKKIGKSTLASMFEGALFFMFEPGARALRVRRVDCNKWEDALGYLAALERDYAAGNLKCKTVIIDTGFEAYEKAKNYVCEQLDIDYPREDNFGKDWNKIKQEFRNFHNRISALGLGIIILCHQSYKEQQDYKGNKYDQVVPLLTPAASDYFRAVIDNVCWYHFRGNERFLLIRGNDHAMAGVALQRDRFFKTTSGEPVYAIPLDGPGDQPYKNIIRAFENKQEKTYREEVEGDAKKAITASITDKLQKAAKKNKRAF